jgi:DNA-binding transcriptional MocR family regulator
MNRTMESIVWAMNARGVSVGAWRVLVTLARKVGRRGFDVWPKHRTLADECEMSLSTVRRALNELEGAGFIVIQERYLEESGDRTSNIYRLQVRQKMTFPGGADLEISPDDEDDESSIPPSQIEQGGPSKLNRPPVHVRPHPLLTGEQAEEEIPLEGIPIEDSPPLLSEGTPPRGKSTFSAIRRNLASSSSGSMSRPSGNHSSPSTRESPRSAR